MEKQLFGKRVEYFRKRAVEKAEYKKDEKVLIFFPHNKTIKTCKTESVSAALKRGVVVEFDIYYFCRDRENKKISFVCEKNIKRRI